MRSTKELVEELAKREGITEYEAGPGEAFELRIRGKKVIDDTGPVRILVVMD